MIRQQVFDYCDRRLQAHNSVPLICDIHLAFPRQDIDEYYYEWVFKNMDRLKTLTDENIVHLQQDLTVQTTIKEILVRFETCGIDLELI